MVFDTNPSNSIYYDVYLTYILCFYQYTIQIQIYLTRDTIIRSYYLMSLVIRHGR